jgi:hypothetical protein
MNRCVALAALARAGLGIHKHRCLAIIDAFLFATYA